MVELLARIIGAAPMKRPDGDIGCAKIGRVWFSHPHTKAYPKVTCLPLAPQVEAKLGPSRHTKVILSFPDKGRDQTVWLVVLYRPFAVEGRMTQGTE